jgi:hypothetical protein
MKSLLSLCFTATLLVVALFAVGCAQMGGGKRGYEKKAGVGPGMNAQGEVVDSKLVEFGYGEYVKGLSGLEGEITGKPAAYSKLKELQIGMSMQQVTDLVGQPTDQGTHVTSKVWIPWSFGSNQYRYELVYKGLGRLLFADGTMGDFTRGHLIWIIHNKTEDGYL